MTYSIHLERNPKSRILKENEATWTMLRKTVLHARKQFQNKTSIKHKKNYLASKAKFGQE